MTIVETYQLNFLMPSRPLRLVKADHPSPILEAFAQFQAAKRLVWTSDHTADGYAVAIQSYIAHHGAYHWPPDVASILDWLGACQDRGLKRTTIKTYWASFKSFLNFLSESGHIDDNPADHIKNLKLVPKVPSRRPRSWPAAMIAEFLSFLRERPESTENLRDCTLVCFLVGTGVRASEACQLRWGDLDLDDGRARIVKAKGSKSRVIYFNDDVRQGLLDWAIWLRIDLSYGHPWVFPSLRAGRLQKSHIGRAGLNARFHQLQFDFGLPREQHYNVHSLRHTHARLAIQAGVPPSDVAAQLGHADPTFTLKWYVESLEEERRAAYRNRFQIGGGAQE